MLGVRKPPSLRELDGRWRHLPQCVSCLRGLGRRRYRGAGASCPSHHVVRAKSFNWRLTKAFKDVVFANSMPRTVGSIDERAAMVHASHAGAPPAVDEWGVST